MRTLARWGMVGLLALTTVVPAPVAAAAPTSSLVITVEGPDDPWCHTTWYYSWSGFKTAAFVEVFIYDETISYDYMSEPAELMPGQIADGGAVPLEPGHQVRFEGRLFAKNGRLIAKALEVVTIPNVTCP